MGVRARVSEALAGEMDVGILELTGQSHHRILRLHGISDG